MQKVVDFLEKNVEWFALGLGGLFFLYMAWTYLIASPVSKPVGSVILTPGSVDDFNAKIAAELQTKIADPTMPPFVVDSFRDSVINGLKLDSLHPSELAMVWNIPRGAVMESSVAGPGGTTQPGGAAAAAVVQALPVPPAAKALLVETGRTTVLKDKDTGSSPTDIGWTTAAFAIPLDKLSSAWNDSFGGNPPKLTGRDLNTVVLAVTLMRSEKLPDGTWSSETPVPRLANNTIMAFPGPDADRMAQENFRVNAAHQGPDITTPKFYDPGPAPYGTIWRDPLELLQQKAGPAKNPAVAAQPDNNNNQQDSQPNDAMASAMRAAQRAGEAAQAAAGAQGGGGGGGPPGGGPAQDNQPPGPAKPAPVVDTKPVEPTVVFAEGVPGTTIPAPLTRMFNPVNAGMSDIIVYLHDETVRPGKTYRYRMVYKLLNPLFVKHDPTLGANPAFASQFDLVSSPSEYSPEISIQERTRFFCAKPNRSSNDKQTFAFDVFTWANGKWKQHTFTVNPGDAIGGMIDGADFSTGYTFIDGRSHNVNSFLVTIVDDDGVAQVKDAQRDFNSTDHKASEEMVGTSGVAPASRPSTTPPTTPRRTAPTAPRPPANFRPPVITPPPPPRYR